MIETPVPLYQHEGEFSRLLDLYRRWQPQRVLELGTWQGGTLYHWLQNAQPNAVVVSVDTYEFDPREDNRDQYPKWTPDGVTLHTVVGRTDNPEVIREVRDLGPYEFVFIDASHAYDDVYHDWLVYGLGMTTKDSVVAFHDILPGTAAYPSDVDKLWKKIRLPHATVEYVDDPKAEWGGIGVVYL